MANRKITTAAPNLATSAKTVIVKALLSSGAIEEETVLIQGQ